MIVMTQLNPMPALLLCGLVLLACYTIHGQAAAETCESSQCVSRRSYGAVLDSSRASHVDLNGLPGFTRSAYHRDHALVTPESRVWAPQPGWVNALTSHLISPASGASFSMYLAQLKAQGQAGAAPAASVERFVLVLNGQAQLTETNGAAPIILPANHYAYFPPNTTARLSSTEGADLLVYERHYIAQGAPVVQHGMVDDSPILPAPGEVFKLRKLLPQTTEYDFNIHIMDFQPGALVLCFHPLLQNT